MVKSDLVIPLAMMQNTVKQCIEFGPEALGLLAFEEIFVRLF